MKKYKKMFILLAGSASNFNIPWQDICSSCGEEHPVDNCNERFCKQQIKKYYKKLAKKEIGR